MIPTVCHAFDNPRSSITALRLYGVILVIVLANPVAAFSSPKWHVSSSPAASCRSTCTTCSRPSTTGDTHPSSLPSGEVKQSNRPDSGQIIALCKTIAVATVTALSAVSIQFANAPTIALALANDDSPASPAATAITNIERGSKLFSDNCAGCHAGGMNYVKEQKTLKKDALAKFITPEFDQPIVQKWVTNSGQHQRIVFFKAPNGKLTERDWADVATYVVDQALNEKW